MTDHSIEPGRPHPPGWGDLNPNFVAGQNDGLRSPRPEPDAPTAFDVKELHRKLEGFSDDELKQIPVLVPGTRLEQGSTYVDMRSSEPAEFTATADMVAQRTNWYVPKSDVPYELWNRLSARARGERAA